MFAEPPEDASFDLLVIAGEASGDEHAARLLRDLRAVRPDLKVAAIGGPELEGAGAHLLFDLTRHAVVGLFEVLANYGFFRKLFAKTVAWAARAKPRAVLLVDYPGFNLRLAEELRKRNVSRKGGGEVRILQYVSPQLWAWKPKRRFAMARTLDALGVIFPFEIDSYADVDLPVRFVGHPFVRPDHVSLLSHAPDAPVLLLPGSRRQPVSRIFPSLLDAFLLATERRPDLRANVVSPPGEARDCVNGILSDRPGAADKVTVKSNNEATAASAVLTSSGTMSLACALAGIPGAIAYRAHPLTYLLGKLLVQVPHLGMANLLLPERPVYPEFIQGRASPVNLSRRLLACLDSPEESSSSQQAAQDLHALLAQPADVSAADWLLAEAFGEEETA